MKKIEKINPNSVISVTEIAPEEQKDNYIYLCNLTTKETVLMSYNPLERVKQFIKYGYAIAKNDNNDLRTEKVQIFINYYGLEVTKFINRNSEDEIVCVCDTVFQATNYIHKHSLDKFCA